jgi:hypothetical protein
LLIGAGPALRAIACEVVHRLREIVNMSSYRDDLAVGEDSDRRALPFFWAPRNHTNRLTDQHGNGPSAARGLTLRRSLLRARHYSQSFVGFRPGLRRSAVPLRRSPLRRSTTGRPPNPRLTAPPIAATCARHWPRFVAAHRHGTDPPTASLSSRWLLRSGAAVPVSSTSRHALLEPPAPYHIAWRSATRTSRDVTVCRGEDVWRRAGHHLDLRRGGTGHSSLVMSPRR